MLAEYLRRLLQYYPETGIFTWRVAPSHCIKAGARAGQDRGRGWRVIEIGGRRYPEHTLAWLYMTGEWRPQQLDHRNRVRGDNRWPNLRLATRAQQQENRNLNRNNTSGAKGVVRVPYASGWRWRAQIERTADGKRKTHYLGFFEDFVAAVAAREAAERAMFPHSALLS